MNCGGGEGGDTSTQNAGAGGLIPFKDTYGLGSPEAPAHTSMPLGSLWSPHSALSCHSFPVCTSVSVLCLLCLPLIMSCSAGPHLGYLCTLLPSHAVQMKSSRYNKVTFSRPLSKANPTLHLCSPPPNYFASLKIFCNHSNKNWFRARITHGC